MTKEEIKTRLQIVAEAIVSSEKPGNEETLKAGFDAAFDLLADALHNIGRIADAMETIATFEYKQVGDVAQFAAKEPTDPAENR